MATEKPPRLRLKITGDLLGTVLVFAVFSLIISVITWLLLGSDPVSRYAQTGDYYFDADRSLLLGAHGHIFGMYDLHPVPAMLPLSLLLRLPSLLLADLFNPHLLSEGINTGFLQQIADHHAVTVRSAMEQRYIIGALPLMMLAGMVFGVSYFPRDWKQHRLFSRVTAAILITILLLNPLSRSALVWGHPEELLMAALVGSAAFSLCRERFILSAVLLAAAIATKQPAVLLLPLFFFTIPKQHRGQAIKAFLITTVVLIVPFIITDLLPVIKANLGYADSGQHLYDHAFDLSTVLGFDDLSSYERVLSGLAALCIPWFLSRKYADHLPPTSFVFLLPLIMLLRCILDPFNIDYYAVTVAVGLLVMETYLWEHRYHPIQVLIKRTRTWSLLPLISLAGAYLISEYTGGSWYVDISSVWSEQVANICFLIVGLLILLALAIAALRPAILSGAGRHKKGLAALFVLALLATVCCGISYVPPATI